MHDEGFKDHFSVAAAEYGAFRPTYPEAVFDFLAGLAPSRALAVDLGCGQGQASLALARRFDAVEALEPSEAQLAGATPHPRVRYRLGRAEATPLADHEADLVLAAQAAHWFDLKLFYPEVRRIAKPGGVCALLSYGRTVISPAIDPIVDDFHFGTLGDYWPEGREHVDSGYATLPFPFAPIEHPEFHLEAEWDLAHLYGYYSSWSAVNRYRKAKGVDPVATIIAPRLGPVWGDPATKRTVRWPLAMKVGRIA